MRLNETTREVPGVSTGRGPAESWFSADRPIVGHGEDRLGRKGFADAIASAIRGWHGRDSLVIALYGPWGTGKSSIKNMIIETLRGSGSSQFVTEFNPWQFANREQMTAAFFDQIGIALDQKTFGSKNDREAIRSNWQRYATYLSASRNLVELLRRLLLWVFLIAGAALLGAAALGDATILTIPAFAFLIGAVLLGMFSDAAEIALTYLRRGVDTGRKSVDQVKKELAASLRRLQHPILVVMDDIDRLTPMEMQEVFQLVKVNADFPNIVYLLLFERTQVENNVQKILGVPGQEYLEKIVQVGFDLPVIERPRLNRILFDGLQELLSDQTVARHFNEMRWGNLFISGLQPYFTTLRQVNRFLATLSCHIALFQSKEVFEVNVIDLIGLEVLRVFEPEVYRALASNKEALTGTPSNGGQREETTRRLLSSIVDRAPEERRSRVREIVRQLFPHAESAFGGSQYSMEAEESWYLEYRVCAHDLFDRYFHFAIPDDDISQDAVDALVAATGDRSRLRAELRSLAGHGLLGIALDRMEASIEKMDPRNFRSLITAIFDLGEEISVERAGAFDISPATHAIRTVQRLLQRRHQSSPFEILRDAIEQTNGLRLPVSLLEVVSTSESRDYRGLEPRGHDSRDQGLSGDQLAQLKKLCLAKIRVAAESGELTINPALGMLLRCWREWGGASQAVEFCKQIVQTPEGVVALANAFLVPANPSAPNQGGRSYIRLSEVEQFLPCELVERGLTGVSVESLTAPEKRAVAAFQRAMDERREGKPEPEFLTYGAS